MDLENKKTPAILKTIQYTGLILAHTFSKSKLKRMPEPHALTDQELHVEDYNKAIHSVMILPYVLVLDMIHRLTDQNEKKFSKKAIDLCCGPGHFTRLLAKYFNCSEVTGVDLSEPMLKKAQENAKKENLTDILKYIKSDVSNLETVESKSVDLVSFMDGAHHMNSTQDITKILREADRVTKPEGMIILLDPVRPKTSSTANLYHRIAGKAYVDLGLTYFNSDFRDSILASWSGAELFQAIPKNTNRKWVQLMPFGFPAFQIIIGLPEGREKLFIGEGLPQEVVAKLIPKEGKSDWSMLKLSFQFAKRRIVQSQFIRAVNSVP